MIEEIKKVTIGIDLGTSNFSVAINTNGIVEVLKDLDNNARIPCVVSFSSNREIFLSFPDKTKSALLEQSIIYEPKRYIGHDWSDTSVQQLIPWVTYCFGISIVSNRLVFTIELPDGILLETPVHIYSLILSKIKEECRRQIEDLDNIQVVITVPANFDINQRAATLKAAELANFQVAELLDEPVAVARYYFLNHEQLEKGEYFMVYNMGGYYFSAAIFVVTDNSFEMIAISNNNEVSGLAFDFIIFDYIRVYANLATGTDILSKTELVRLLQVKCEEAKICLSTETTYTLTLEQTNFFFTHEITRVRFEEIVEPLINKTVLIVDQLLNEENLSKQLIRKVILYGGSAKIPKIQQVLINYFEGEVLTTELVDHETSVAEGAAIQADKLCYQTINSFFNLPLTPMSIDAEDI